MKGVQIVEPNKLQIVDLEKPQIDKENNVLVRMVAAGICGSDVGIYHGTNAAATYPRIIGHENVGIVEEIGEGVTRVKVGDRVIIDQVTACGHCYACRKGRPNVCGNLKVRGVHIDGGYREYMAVPDRDCYLVPEILSDEEAVMIEPTTIAVQCCSRAELESEDTVMIIGSGALGSSILRIVKLYNPKAIIVTDIDDARLARAESIYTVEHAKEMGVELHYVNTAKPGCDTNYLRELSGGTGYDDVICFAPVKPVVEQASDILGFDGCLNFFAGPTNSQFKAEFNWYNVHYLYTHVVGTSGGNTSDMKEAIEMMTSGKINPAAMITHIGGLNAVVDTVLNLPKIPGGKKLIYTQIELPLTAIADFGKLGETDPLFAKLDEITKRHNGLWSAEAEKYLLANK